MSHIAVDLKVIEVHAPGVARAAGVSEDRILAGLVRLWHRCWSTKSATISRTALAASMGGERIDEIANAMVDAGLLEALTDGWRVRGADRYLRLAEARSRGGKAAAKHLVPGARFSASAQSQPRASPEPAEKPSGLVSALSPSTEHRAPNITTKNTAPAPRAPRDSDLLEQDFEAVTGSQYGWNGAKDGAALAWCLKQAPLEEVRARWRRGLAADGWLLVRTVAQLRSKWNDLAPPPSGLGVFTANSISEGM